jgi:hypothetical protein
MLYLGRALAEPAMEQNVDNCFIKVLYNRNLSLFTLSVRGEWKVISKIHKIMLRVPVKLSSGLTSQITQEQIADTLVNRSVRGIV